MAEHEPFELLAALAHDDETPDPQFADRLEADLLEALAAPPSATAAAATGRFHHRHVIELEEDMSQSPEPRRSPRWMVPALAAAVVALVVAGIVVLRRDDGDTLTDVPPATTAAPTTVAAEETPATTTPDSTPDSTPASTDPPATTVAPEDEALAPPLRLPPIEPAVPPPASLSLETARGLLDAVGGSDGLLLGAVEEATDRSIVTFDPNDPNRALGASGDWTTGAAAVVWEVRPDAVTASPFNDETDRFGGVFQADGSVAEDESTTVNELRYVSDASGDALATILAGFSTDPFWPSEGDRSFMLVTAVGGGCPYSRLTLGTPERTVILDDRMNAYSRTAIVQPGVGIAFNRLAHEFCDEPTAETTTAWDLATGEPLPDHPLAGRNLGWAARSGDGSRWIVIDGDGVVSVEDVATGDVVAELGTFEARRSHIPLALNHDGSLAIVVSDDGSATLWHVASGELLTELTGDTRPYPFAGTLPGPQTGASPSYDATRVATLDLSGTPTWSFFTLDPNEWLTRACAAGFEISDEERATNGFDPSVTCAP